MTISIDIVIPVADYHTGSSSGAIAAAHAQTVPCGVIVVHDVERRGAGAARNQGARQSSADFLVFLDADDDLRPDALALFLRHYQRGRYVYCDDRQGDSIHQTPDQCAYLDGTWHTVTTLLPRVFFDLAGGFDETLPAQEDLDLYLRLQALGVCGVRCPHVLLDYSDQGQRSKSFKASPAYQQTKQAIYKRYGGAAKMSCCGQTVNKPVNDDDKQEGDILAMALYTPMRMGGPVSGRIYPKPLGFNGYKLWVDPQDAAARPNLWRPLGNPNEMGPAVDAVLALAESE